MCTYCTKLHGGIAKGVVVGGDARNPIIAWEPIVTPDGHTIEPHQEVAVTRESELPAIVITERRPGWIARLRARLTRSKSTSD